MEMLFSLEILFVLQTKAWYVRGDLSKIAYSIRISVLKLTMEVQLQLFAITLTIHIMMITSLPLQLNLFGSQSMSSKI